MVDRRPLESEIVVIGAGIAGLVIADLLSARGRQITVVAPDTVPGRSVACAGQLHSGLRYAAVDPDAARLCSVSLSENTQRFAPFLTPNATMALCVDRSSADVLDERARELGVPIRRAERSDVAAMALTPRALPFILPDRQVDVRRMLRRIPVILRARGVRRVQARVATEPGETQPHLSDTVGRRELRAEIIVDTAHVIGRPFTANDRTVWGSMTALEQPVMPGIVVIWSPTGRSDLDTVATIAGKGYVGSTWAERPEDAVADRAAVHQSLAPVLRDPPAVSRAGHLVADRLVAAGGSWSRPLMRSESFGGMHLITVDIAKMTHCFTAADAVSAEIEKVA